MDCERELRKETEKWLGRIKKEIRGIRLLKKGKEDLIENARSYVKDCEYFLEKKELVRAFESVIWAWSWIEIMKELEIIRS
jgi:hypothetical protein